VLNEHEWLTQSEEAPYLPLTDELESDELDLDKANPGGAESVDLSADEAGALYNYFVLARGSALGVHNPIYTEQLIYDSYFALTGEAPDIMPTRPEP